MSAIKVKPDVKQEIELYRRYMMEHEYTTYSTLGYSTYVLRFLRWQEQNQNNSLQQDIRNFLKKQQECSPKVYKECRAAVYLYFKMVVGENFPKRPPKERNPDIETILDRFYNYSVNIKRIRPYSAEREVSSVRNFLEHISIDGLQNLEKITASDIREFLMNKLAHLKDSSKGREVTGIRNFFKFQKFEGVSIHTSIFLLPLSPAVWRKSTFPKTMDEETFNILSEIPDTNTATGKRDRCIILFFTELGLRCVEVGALTIDDFNWREGYVAINNTKNRLDRNLPLSKKLSEAVIEYLRNARPQTNNRTLFVRFKHICGEPMWLSQIRSVVRRIYAKSSIGITETGTHILRRTAGSKIYNSGNSLKMTADMLGHESLDSTVYYVKTDIVGLSEVAAPWPSAVVKAGVHSDK